MAKYSNELKLKVVKYHLQEYGVKHTDKVFSSDHAAIRNRASRYMLYRENGIKRRTGITVVPLDFKSNAIRMVINKGLFQKETSARLNLPTDSILAQWLHRYGIDGLKDKSKGRKPVKKLKQTKTVKEAGHLKTKKRQQISAEYFLH